MNSRRLMGIPSVRGLHPYHIVEKPCCATQHSGPPDFRNGSFAPVSAASLLQADLRDDARLFRVGVKTGPASDVCSMSASRLLSGREGIIAACRTRAITGCEQLQQNSSLFDDVVGTGEQRRRSCEAGGLGGFEIAAEIKR